MPSETPSTPWPLHLATFATVVCITVGLSAIIGPGLGLFLGGLAIACLLAPSAAALWPTRGQGMLAAACVIDGIALVWLYGVWKDPAIGLGQWLGAYGILIAVVLLQVALLLPLARIGLARPSAAGLLAILALLWLMVPVWLIPHLQTPALLPWMHRLIAIHPLFAINSVIPHPIWTELPVAYTLSNLNQDVAYTLPSSPLPAILFHSVPAIVLLLIQIKASNRMPRY